MLLVKLLLNDLTCSKKLLDTPKPDKSRIISIPDADFIKTKQMDMDSRRVLELVKQNQQASKTVMYNFSSQLIKHMRERKTLPDF